MDDDSALQDWRRMEISGIPAFWMPAPGPLTIGLVFGVGAADESLITRGVDHLIEHLALFGLDHRRAEFNGQVTDGATSFLATGSVDEVNVVLSHVGQHLARLPYDRLDRERAVLRTEAQGRRPSVAGEHLVLRFGTQGLGTLDALELGLWSQDVASLDRWRSDWFGAGNAAIAVSGPTIDGLQVDLPSGSPPARLPVPPELIQVPSWSSAFGDFVVASFVGPRTPSLSVATQVLAFAIEDRLRTQDGHSYSISHSFYGVGNDRTLFTIGADCLSGHGKAVQEAMVVVLNRLRTTGPTDDELDLARTVLQRQYRDPRSAFGQAMQAAESHVRGRPPLPASEFLQAFLATTAEQVAAILDDAHRTMLLTVPHGTAVADHRYRLVDQWSDAAIEGTTYQPGADTNPEGADQRLVIGPDGVTRRFGEHVVTVRWKEARSIVRRPDRTWILTGNDGFRIVVSARFWFRGNDAIADLGLFAPRSRIVDIDEPYAPDLPDTDPPGPMPATPPSAPAPVAGAGAAKQRPKPLPEAARQARRKAYLAMIVLVFVLLALILVMTTSSGDSDALPSLAVPVIVAVVATMRLRRN